VSKRSKAVLDSAAFLNSSSFLLYENAITTPSVISEIHSERSAIVDSLLESGALEVEEPSEKSIKKVRETARKIGELKKLSKTDIEVLAMALDVGGVIYSDDFHVQNVAAFLGIPYHGVTEEIKEKRVWVKRCTRCGAEYPPTYEGTHCPKCGGKLVYSSKRVLSDT
jgi:UPF0271 protein